ncbi:LacI family DNA-binding transcriptional regulator [Planomicrobium sp. CPCC 101079]|uniref:LacI family DNA-binding transcriptional regulator n=1 Tax=Planomicrobium sp. CPCC 101079 TaxID=2599618 RepID=UPI0011B674C4|nr:LacI family DNA-binding transcriptional regulator [Planomicrobium sp. CPCC 101079]TWT14599.1 LacI family transcriptional regulator [Planomicrobium sp. CPCC 101079]
MATIKDVAKKAGVSISVVSKTYNNYVDVSEETRQRIFAVAKELDYTPNIVAKNLSSKKQMTLGLISSGVLNDNEKDNNAFDIFKGVYREISETRFELSINLIDSQKQKQQSYVQYCRERNIGGAILQGIRTDDQYYKELLNTNIPCVVLDIMNETENGLIGSVSIDNALASKEMALYLLERNHRNLAVVSGTKETYVNKERMKGLEEALHAHGMKLDDVDFLDADFSEEAAYELSKMYLQKTQPTAFFCFSDLMAFGVIKAIKEAGLRIPEDISVTGFDDLIFSSYTQPPLTTIKQDFVEIGKVAARLLQDIKENNLERQHIWVKHQLMARESVKTLPSV